MSTKYYSNKREEMLEFVPMNSKKILIVGCAKGEFGNEIIRRQKAEVWGIEPNTSSAMEAGKTFHKVINDYFSSELNLPNNYFDCIVFNDVLEHMTDPWSALKMSKKLLNIKQNSVVIASIPNFRFIGNLFEILIKKDFKYKDAGILDKTHYRFFTNKSIVRLFTNEGFEITKIVGISNTKHILFKILNLLTFKIFDDMKSRQFAVVAKSNK